MVGTEGDCRGLQDWAAMRTSRVMLGVFRTCRAAQEAATGARLSMECLRKSLERSAFTRPLRVIHARM
eukprot:6183742-Pleurochrysis_carterae.AAC.2